MTPLKSTQNIVFIKRPALRRIGLLSTGKGSRGVPNGRPYFLGVDTEDVRASFWRVNGHIIKWRIVNDMNKQKMLDGLTDFITQRPGLEFGNYGSATEYRAEMRRISKYLAPCLFLISKAYADDTLTAEQIAEMATRTFSGRLHWEEDKPSPGWEYTTGQYWPTEYRLAVWQLLKALLPVYAGHKKFKSL